MNRTVVAAGALAVASLAATITVAFTSHSDVTSIRSQVRAQHAQIVQLETQLSGARQDVITCGDLQTLDQLLDGVTFTQGYFGTAEFTAGNTTITSLPLPAHCINR